MSNNPQQLVQKLWNYCSILRDDGLSYRVCGTVLGNSAILILGLRSNRAEI
jgi:hypothetical protein